jgi:hypothetical protein
MIQKRIFMGLLIVFLGLIGLQTVEAQSDIWYCNECGRRVWDSDSGLPRPSSCPYCSGGSSSSSGSSYTPPPVDYEALRRQREAAAAARAERERLRRERAAREAEEKAQKERNKAAEAALKTWEREDAAALASQKKSSGGLSPLLKKSQKLPCAFCENGWRDCPWCDGAKIHCSRSGCINGQEICGCVKAANNYQPDPNCPHCHGKGMNVCEACGGKSAWACPHCNGTGKLPCLHCQGLQMASSSMDIQPTAIGPTSIRPMPWKMPGAYPLSARVEAEDALITRFAGLNPDAEDLRRLDQAQKKLAEEDQRLAKATSVTPPPGKLPADLVAAREALEARELTLIQQAMDRLSGSDVPADPAKKQALLDQTKADFANDAERNKLAAEIARLEGIPAPKAAAQSIPQGGSSGNSSSVTVPSFSATVPILPGAQPAVTGPLGKPVGASAGEIKRLMTNIENSRWDDEARMVEVRQTIQDAESAAAFFNQKVELAKADYEKLKGRPGTPATFDEYLIQRRATDTSLDFWWKKIEEGRSGYWHARRREKWLQENIDFRDRFYKELLGENPEAPKIAAQVRQETMNQRIAQLEGIVEAQKQAVAKDNANVAKLEQEYKKQEDAYLRRFEAERPAAQKEYDRLDPQRKAAQDFESYLSIKVWETPEAQAFFDPKLDFYKNLASFSDCINQENRNRLQEAQQKLQALRQRGTLLGGSEWWNKKATTLHPDRSGMDDFLEFYLLFMQ